MPKKKKHIYLGNLDAKRDWGFAPEYVEGMYNILQQNKGGDYVLGTGETHSVQEFVNEAFNYADLNIEEVVKTDKRFLRPTEVDVLIADCTKSNKELGWKPKIGFKDLVKIMVDSDMRNKKLEPIGEGDEILAKKFPNRWWSTD